MRERAWQTCGTGARKLQKVALQNLATNLQARLQRGS